MIFKTKNYEMFIFRADNREKIDQVHVQKLVESIKSRNMLDLRPICVNEKMEIIDGQHRLLAAKLLNVEIYYQQDKTLKAEDIILMNVSKAWGTSDYLNFYCEHGYSEYIKFKDFMKRYNLNLKVGLNIAMGQKHINFEQFRKGEFHFHEETLSSQIEICWETIDYIKKLNGFSTYTSSSRFWRALLKIIRHPDFEVDKWRLNMKRMIDHFAPKARTEDYVQTFSNVYNYKTHIKINFLEG